MQMCRPLAQGTWFAVMADEREKSDDSTRFAAGRGADDETRFTGVGSPPATGGKSDATFPPGSIIGHTYRIEAFLARGGMGEVYRASHVELNTEHAIKIILPELANNQRIVDLFRREASVLRNVRHDAVVAYDGVFRDENARLYLVMEFADGPSLSKLMRERPLDADEVRQLRDRLADGLAVAHDKGVVHRDISPDNVILPGGDLDKAKIIDFGISKAVDPEVKTIIGDDFAGKYSYVSPEQLGMFGGKIDGRSDIYSLGLVLAAAALGEPLDMGLSPISVIEARRAVPDLSRVPAAVRADLAAMLQPDPAQRPQTMRELIRTSEQRGGRRSTLSDTSHQSSPSKPGSRRMGAIVGALAVIVAAGGALGYWYWQGRAGRDHVTGTTQQADNGVQQTGTNAALNSGAADGQGAQQSTASTTATQTQTSISAEGGTGATGTQQQETAAGATSSSAGATAADSGQASGSNSTTPASSGNQSATATQNGTAGAAGDDGQSQSQQENASTTVAPTVTGQTAAGTASSQQQASNATPAVNDLQSSAATGTAAAGGQSATEGLATTDTTSPPTTQNAGAATSNATTPNANVATAESGAAGGTTVTGTQTALLPQVPDIEKLRGQAQQAVGTLECAGVLVNVSAQGDIAASGYVESEADRAKAVAALAALPQVGRVDNAIEVQTWPLCKVLGVLQEGVAIDVGGPSAPRIDPGGPYHEGKDSLNLTITPSRDGYLYVDYIDAANADPKKRYALHLMPSPLRDPNNYVKAGKRVVIGSLPREREIYVFNPPLGANMVLVILSPQPLFQKARPQEEDGDDAGAYLADLGVALTAIAQRVGPGKLSVATSSLTFVAR
jgi:serine/threonine protein kinase